MTNHKRVISITFGTLIAINIMMGMVNISALDDISKAHEKVINSSVPVINELDQLKSSALRIVASSMEYNLLVHLRRHKLNGEISDAKLMTELRSEEQEELEHVDIENKYLEDHYIFYSKALGHIKPALALKLQIDESTVSDFLKTSRQFIELTDKGHSSNDLGELKEHFEYLETLLLETIDHHRGLLTDELKAEKSDVKSFTAKIQSATGIINLVSVVLIAIAAGFFSLNLTRLRDAQAQLLENAKLAALGKMAGGVAHEINNPLTIISTCIVRVKMNLNKTPVPIGAIESALQKMDDAILRIVKIVSGMREISQGDSENLKSPVQISSVIGNVIGICAEKYKSQGVELRLNLHSVGMESTVLGDSVQLSQVFINLLDNAADAIELLDSKWIQIESKIVGRDLVVQVIDSGRGVSEAIKTKLLDPFFTTKDVGKGTGLGLSIAKGIIERHRGKITVGNCAIGQHQHTCFSVHLPIDSAGTAKTKAA